MFLVQTDFSHRKNKKSVRINNQNLYYFIHNFSNTTNNVLACIHSTTTEEF